MQYQKVTKQDVQKIIIAEAHLGNKTSESCMQQYIYGKQNDKVNIFDIDKMYTKIQLAAAIICGISNPKDILVCGKREEASRAIHKFSTYLKCQEISGRFYPGTLTNKQSPSFHEPKLIIVADPTVDHQVVLESSYTNIPVIGFCNSDTKLNYVDCAIPCNNKGKKAIGLMFWMLCREVLRMKGNISRDADWCMPDTFVMITDKEIEEQQKKEEEAKQAEEQQAEDDEIPVQKIADRQRKQFDNQEAEEEDPFNNQEAGDDPFNNA